MNDGVSNSDIYVLIAWLVLFVVAVLPVIL